MYDTSWPRVAADITAKLSSIEALLKGKQSYLRKLDETNFAAVLNGRNRRGNRRKCKLGSKM